jgi:hypothetical protein
MVEICGSNHFVNGMLLGDRISRLYGLVTIHRPDGGSFIKSLQGNERNFINISAGRS